jgi:tetratricopeptide (TPR) repeat protein
MNSEPASAQARSAEAWAPDLDLDRIPDLLGAGLLDEDPSSLVSAVSLCEKHLASDAVAEDTELRSFYALHLMWGLRFLHEHTQEQHVLDQAVDAGWDCLASASRESGRWALQVGEMVTLLFMRWKARNSVADLASAIRLLQRVLGTDDLDPRETADLRWQLVQALVMRYAETEQFADLDDVVDVGRALVSSPGPVPERREAFSTVAHVMIQRYHHRGSVHDLDDAIDLLRRALTEDDAGVAESDFPSRHTLESNLADALHLRYRRAGESADLLRGTDLSLRLRAAPMEESDIHLRVAAIGTVIMDLSGGGANEHSLDTSISIFRLLVARTDRQHEDYASFVFCLGDSLLLKAKAHGDPEALAEATTALNVAFSLADRDDEQWPLYAINLARAFHLKYLTAGDEQALNKAVVLAQAAIRAADPQEGPRHRHLSTLYAEFARLLELRHDVTHDLGDLYTAIAAGRRASELPEADPSWRLEGARLGADLAMKAGLVPVAIEGYEAALAFLKEVVWLGLTRTTRERHLVPLAGLGRDGAAAALAGADPAWALSLLEAGQATLWSQGLDLQGDLSALAALEERRPDLAGRLHALGARLLR